MTIPDETKESVDVLVVGAGPVGLFAGLCAARNGFKVALLDHVWRGYGRGHATLLHAGTLRALEEYGVADTLRAQGHPVHKLKLQIDGTNTVTLDLPSPALTVSQSILETVLLEALRQQQVEVRSPYEAATVYQQSDQVEVRVVRRELVTLGSPDHHSEWEPVESSTMSANFVIGADGYDSRMRSALSIDTVEVGSAESFALFELPNSNQASTTANLYFNDGLGSVMYPLSDGRARWGFQLDGGLDATPDIERWRQLVAERAPGCVDGVERVDWGSMVHFERRVARRFGKGRVWLAGDAAHITSPLGNQSMNVGLLEAEELVRRIGEAHRSGTFAPLEAYAAGRSRDWYKLLGVNVSFELLPHAPRWLSTYARKLVPALPASGEDLMDILAAIGLRLD